jgi:hypothetical protein
MAIKFTRAPFASVTQLLPGQLISFGYGESSAIRTAIVITSAWKGNCDCYEFGGLTDIPPELLEWIATNKPLNAGDLYANFRDDHPFKSFKLDKMRGVIVSEFNTYEVEEGEERDVSERDGFVLDFATGTVSGHEKSFYELGVYDVGSARNENAEEQLQSEE